jgi:multiple antibiotic resistance protein
VLSDEALQALVTLFASIGPIDTAPLFIALTAGAKAQVRQRIALQAVLVGAGVLLLFALAGNRLLALLGVSLPAFRVAGGILLLLLAVDLLFAHPTGLSSITAGEEHEAERQADVAIFPLAVPLIAGPGSMTAVMLLMGRAGGDVLKAATVLAMLGLVLLMTLAVLLTAERVMRLGGLTGANAVARVSGVLLAGLAVQFVLDGLREASLFR